MISIFLGAGFSVLGKVPLASQLFEENPEVDAISRRRLIDRVLEGWRKWHKQTGGTPEQYLSALETHDGAQWHDATWYVALVIALRMGSVRVVGERTTIVRHTLNVTSGIAAHETFWTTVFRRTEDVAILTTNYDIIAERGLRPERRPKVPRPGFNYGEGKEYLIGGGYPSYTHIRPIIARGNVPILKLHGSVSWAFSKNRIVRYHDCRPAIQGKAIIIAPVTEKHVPEIFRPIWDHAASALAASDIWIIVGYSFPCYDFAVNELLRSKAHHGLRVHILNPDPGVADRVRSLLPHTIIHSHPGLPEALDDLRRILDCQS